MPDTPLTGLPPTPALEHMKAQADKLHTQAIGDFLDWLGQQGIHLTRSDAHGDYYPLHTSKTALLAEYAGVDLAACEAERRAILVSIRGEG